MTWDDDGLRQEASRGDADARAELLVRYLPALRTFLRVRMGPALRGKETPEDLAQSVCREVLMDLPAFEDRGEPAFRRWLFMTAARKIQDRATHYGREKRDSRRERPIEDGLTAECASQLTPSRVAMGHEDVAQLTAALDTMPEEQRTIIAYARLLGMTHPEIARELRLTEGQVRGQLYRGLARLGTALEP